MIKEGEELFYACWDETVCTEVSGGNGAFFERITILVSGILIIITFVQRNSVNL